MPYVDSIENRGAMNRAQKEKVEQFRDITSASETISTEFLKKHNFNLEAAIEDFFANPRSASKTSSSSSAVKPDPNALLALFNKYKENEDTIGQEGIVQFAQDLGVSVEDVSMLVFAHKIKSKRMGVITKKEWTEGLAALGCYNIQAIQTGLANWKRDLETPAKFKEFYLFCFMYSKEDVQKNLDVEMATALWQLLLPGRFILLEPWLEFIQASKTKVISKDAWGLMIEFNNQTKGDISKYDDQGAWPVLFDSFVEWYRSKSQ